MIKRLKRISKEKYWDYFILVARFLLGWTMLRYGYSKLIDGGQFGISASEMSKPIGELSLFRVSWYLFDHQPFKAGTGIIQLICGLLLIVNRTTIIGAFLFIPLITTILLIDLSFMPPALAAGFGWRLSFYIALDALILWHYKERMQIIWDAVGQNITTKFRFPIWAYLVLPLLAIGLEIAGVIPKLMYTLFTNPVQIMGWMKGILKLIGA